MDDEIQVLEVIQLQLAAADYRVRTFGNARSIADLAEIIREVVPEVCLQQAPPAPEKPKRGTLKMDRAREYLGFVPSKPIDSGYREFCEWYADKWKSA